MIKVIIFDADHTLLEFDEDEKRAFALAFADYGITLSPIECSACRDFSYQCWAELGLNDVHTQEIQLSYHQRYRDYVPVMFQTLAKKYGVEEHEKEVTQKFLSYLSMPSFLIGSAKQTVKKLSEKYKICIATNGLADMQKNRLSELAPYVSHLFISEEMGCIKPHNDFFKKMIGELKVLPDECLMVGDSLSSDMAGAIAYGLKSCWFNRFHLKNDKPFVPDKEIFAIEEVEDYLKELNNE